MTQNNIHPLQNHQASATGLVDDPLTELLRQGARKLIEEAVVPNWRRCSSAPGT